MASVPAIVPLQASIRAEKPWTCASAGVAWSSRAAICPHALRSAASPLRMDCSKAGAGATLTMVTPRSTSLPRPATTRFASCGNRARRPAGAGPRRLRPAPSILGYGPNSTDLAEVAVPAEAILEPARSGNAVLNQRFASIVPFLNKPFAHPKPMASNGGTAVRTHADLRKARDLLCQFLGLLAGSPFGGDVLAQANGQALFRGYLSSGENDLEGSALADHPG